MAKDAINAAIVAVDSLLYTRSTIVTCSIFLFGIFIFLKEAGKLIEGLHLLASQIHGIYGRFQRTALIENRIVCIADRFTILRSGDQALFDLLLVILATLEDVER